MIETAKKAAKSAGKIVLNYFNKSLKFKQKADQTFVSIADQEAEKEIKRIIHKSYPYHSISGEETGKTGNTKIIWHVDPLDGTNNFKNKIPYSCVSIGIEKDGQFVVGVIYNPFSDEMFYAEKGKGAFLNGKSIKVNALSLSEGISVVDAFFRVDKGERKLRCLEKLIEISPFLRMIGSNALQLTEVARGNCVSSLSDAVHSYDFAAGSVIVREAGGVVTDQYGNEPNEKSTVIIASNNAKNHYKLIELTKKFYKDFKGL